VTPQFKTGLSNSYKCIKEQQLDLTLKDNNVTVGFLKVTNLQFQAFRDDNTTIFGLGEYSVFYLIACNMNYFYIAIVTMNLFVPFIFSFS